MDLFSVFEQEAEKSLTAPKAVEKPGPVLFPTTPTSSSIVAVDAEPESAPVSELIGVKRKHPDADVAEESPKKRKLDDETPLVLQVAKGHAEAVAAKAAVMDEPSRTTVAVMREVAYPPNWGMCGAQRCLQVD